MHGKRHSGLNVDNWTCHCPDTSARLCSMVGRGEETTRAMVSIISKVGGNCDGFDKDGQENYYMKINWSSLIFLPPFYWDETASDRHFLKMQIMKLPGVAVPGLFTCLRGY